MSIDPRDMPNTIRCRDIQSAANYNRREGFADGLLKFGPARIHSGNVDEYVRPYCLPFDEVEPIANEWEIHEALRALRLAVEKADRIGGDMKYSDIPGCDDNPNACTAWYRLAKSVLERNSAS